MPEAIAPIETPRKNGAAAEPMANTTSQANCCALGADQIAAEREADAAKHDAGQCQQQWNPQRLADRGERGRERAEHHHQHEDQPHVVGFPHGADGVVHQCPLFFAGLQRGVHFPNAGAKVRAGKQGVNRQADQHEHQGDNLGGHAVESPTGTSARRRSTEIVPTAITA